MALNRSQKFMYFQNKAQHYNKLRFIKSTIDDGPPKSLIPKPKRYRPLPLMKEHSIQVQNEHIIQRLVNIARSPRSQVQTEGCYSRYNKVERPFRQMNPFKAQTERNISIDNSDLTDRIQKMKPAIGSNNHWAKEYSRSLCCKRNLSRFLQTNRSKAEIHISTDRFVPQHLRDLVLTDNLDSSVCGKQATVSMKKLFQLPVIKKHSKRINFQFGEFSRLRSELEDR